MTEATYKRKDGCQRSSGLYPIMSYVFALLLYKVYSIEKHFVCSAAVWFFPSYLPLPMPTLRHRGERRELTIRLLSCISLV